MNKFSLIKNRLLCPYFSHFAMNGQTLYYGRVLILPLLALGLNSVTPLLDSTCPDASARLSRSSILPSIPDKHPSLWEAGIPCFNNCHSQTHLLMQLVRTLVFRVFKLFLPIPQNTVERPCLSQPGLPVHKAQWAQSLQKCFNLISLKITRAQWI